MSSKQKFIQPVIDVQEDLLECLEDLFPIADVKSSNDALVLVLHAFMLEVGFIPKDVPENKKSKLLPKNWQDSGVYRIMYYHLTCPELCCLMTCVPLNQLLSVFGTVDDVSEFQKTTLCLQVNRYVNCTIGFSEPSKVFSSMKELSQSFKDNFAYTLLAAMQDALGFGPTFGLPAAMDHIKVQILSSLPVGSLIAMSCVNKEFNELCNTSSLWKNLYLKDFSVALVDSEEVKQDGWKELYKKKYLQQKQKRQHVVHRVMQCFPPSVFPGFDFRHPVTEWYPPPHPPLGVGPANQIGIPEEVRTAFPQLQRRTVPNVMHEPLFPQNPSLNVPGIFRFF